MEASNILDSKSLRSQDCPVLGSIITFAESSSTSTLFPTFVVKSCNGVELFNAEPETEDGGVEVMVANHLNPTLETFV